MTLIGNTETLAFELTPVAPSWERRYAPERAAWAGVAIWVDGRNLCSHIVPGTSEVQDALFLPLAPMADWLARSAGAMEYEERAADFPTTAQLHETADRWADAQPPSGMNEDEWLDARDAWYSRHFLRAGADGARVPDIAFVRDDEHLVLNWRRPRFFGHSSPIMLWPEGDFSVPWQEGWNALTTFISRVAGWMREAGVEDLDSWATTGESQALRDADFMSAIEYFTGRDLNALASILRVEAQAAPVLERLGLTPGATDPAASAVCQMLRDVSPRPAPGLVTGLDAIAEGLGRNEPDHSGRWHQARSVSCDAGGTAHTLEEAGQLAANALRQAMGLDGRPIDDMPKVALDFGVAHQDLDVPGDGERMLVGAHEGGSPASVTLDSGRTRTHWGRRFETARALGHVLLDPMREGAIGAAGGPYSQATRRRRSGAFAAELLFPTAAMADVSDHRLDGAVDGNRFGPALSSYGIGARAAAHQLWNGGWLSSRVVRDELIDQFAQQV